MANTLTIDFALFEFVSGNRKVSRAYGKKNFTVTGDRFIHNIQEIGVADEAIELGDIAAGGFSFWWNHDTTNFVEIRAATAETDLIKIGAGELAVFRLIAAAPYAIADTDAVELEYVILEA